MKILYEHYQIETTPCVLIVKLSARDVCVCAMRGQCRKQMMHKLYVYMVTASRVWAAGLPVFVAKNNILAF